MTKMKRSLRRTACAAAILGLFAALPAGAAAAATDTGAARAASLVAHPAGSTWIVVGTYQYKSDCDRAGPSYGRSWRCVRDEPVYDLIVPSV